jgi:hypothetical protein
MTVHERSCMLGSREFEYAELPGILLCIGSPELPVLDFAGRL